MAKRSIRISQETARDLAARAKSGVVAQILAVAVRAARALKIDGRAATDPGKSGWWSQGEFAGTLPMVLAPEVEAQFTRQRPVTFANRAAYRYDYSVEQENSVWRVSADSSGYAPAHGGTIWIDRETSRVLRLEISARNLQAKFPLSAVTTTVEYGFVKIGDGKYLLPSHSETVICQRDSAVCHRNVTDFRNYRKYTADTNIKFE